MECYNDLYHSGVLGMKWGHHKYHNSDGSYNDSVSRLYDSDITYKQY